MSVFSGSYRSKAIPVWEDIIREAGVHGQILEYGDMAKLSIEITMDPVKIAKILGIILDKPYKELLSEYNLRSIK